VERSGITSWDFGDLPRTLGRRVLGTELTSFVALDDCQSAVAIRLFESEAAANAAHRNGVRRLLQLACKNILASFVKRAPAPFVRRVGLPVPRAEMEAFRDALLARVVSEAFELGDQSTSLPRSKAEFDKLVAVGAARLPRVFEAVVELVSRVDAELQATLRSLDNAAKQKSGGAAVSDIRAQIEELFPAELISEVDLLRLQQFPRYLRAAQARLSRAINDPRKDAAKAAPFAPLWQGFLTKRTKVKDARTVERVHYLLEELRVALFAPELKPAQPVTVASAAVALEALR
jgi:ATP-dependent helicase HrpA